MDFLTNENNIVEIKIGRNEEVIVMAHSIVFFDQGLTKRFIRSTLKTREKFYRLFLFYVKKFLTNSDARIYISNETGSEKILCVSSHFLGSIFCLELGCEYKVSYVRKDALICMPPDVSFTLPHLKISSDFLRNYNFLKSTTLQRVSGQGKIVLNAMGSVIRKDISNGSIYVQAHCIIALVGDVEFKCDCFNFNETSLNYNSSDLILVSGNGSVWLQSSNINRIRNQVFFEKNNGDYPTSDDGDD
ncbi:AIM24 family protein [Vibrio alginolyticus]